MIHSGWGELTACCFGVVFLLSPLPVYLPGLPSHPQYELMKRQCSGCPGMITFYIKGKLEHATSFLSNLKVIRDRTVRELHSAEDQTITLCVRISFPSCLNQGCPIFSGKFRCGCRFSFQPSRIHTRFYGKPRSTDFNQEKSGAAPAGLECEPAPAPELSR